jgi:DNA-directed RNA polymerase specialized sigma24 family protein
MDVIPDSAPGFEERFAALAAISYRVGYRLVGDRAEAEDLAQEALARAYTSWRKVAGHDEAWVTRVTTNLAISGDAAGAAATGGAAGDRADRAGPHGRLPHADLLDHLELMAGLRSLTRRQREVVVLRYLADLPEAEVAAALGCATGTVKQHAHRGLAALRQRLGHLRSPADRHETEEEADVRASR